MIRISNSGPVSVLLSLLMTVGVSQADELGVRCRFNGETGPNLESASLWSQRWDLGPGVQQVNDDCEAILWFEEDPEPQWVGTAMPPRLSFLRTRIEIGVGSDFVLLPGESFDFLKIDGIDLRGGPPPGHLVEVSIARPLVGEPDEYELTVAWSSDDEGGLLVDRRRTIPPGERLLLRLDWEASHDKNHDYQPDRDGFVRLFVGNELVLEAPDLVIDRYSITELRFGYKKDAPPGTYGTFYMRPLGVDTGYFDASK